MLLYRVFPYLSTAGPGEPGHARHVHTPQGRNRLDNPGEYVCWYLSGEASGAVGEVFADLTRWSDEMFEAPFLPGARRALGVYSVPDDLPLLDLDDARNLLDRNLRPTQVVERNRPATQRWALDIFNERNPDGSRGWNGVRWWSYHRPQWRIYGLWEVTPVIEQVQALGLAHPAVVDAAVVLRRPL